MDRLRALAEIVHKTKSTLGQQIADMDRRTQQLQRNLEVCRSGLHDLCLVEKQLEEMIRDAAKGN